MSPAGEVLDGRYRIRARLGAGGMGEVYLAERVRLGDDVAIKFIRSETAADPAARDRFMSEARSCAALRHPNIVSVLDYGIDEERGPFLVMEYLNGPNLAAEIAASGPLAVNRAATITSALAAALDVAHAAGLVHRDVKPANIVAHRYGNGDLLYKIVDFGIGLMIDRTAATATRTPALGSLAYAPPEQLLGEHVDHRADVYGLGALTFEMLTGQPPFMADDSHRLLTRVMFEAAPRPSSFRQSIDQHVDAAVCRALEKEPGRRWPTAGAFAQALGGGPIDRPHSASGPHPSPLHERYELGEQIDTGRFGSEIYAARHRAIGNAVVVRILRRQRESSWATARARFLREARAMQVTHPALLQVRDFGEDADLVYVVTDRVGGISLRALLDAENRLPWARARRLMLDLLSATNAVHKRGGLLFGLTPSIVRVNRDANEDHLVISSAGVAEVQDVLAWAGDDGLRALEVPNSDLLYVAPEILLGEEADGRSDLYTAGVLAYEMLTGRPPFRAFTIPQLVVQIFSAAYDDIHSLAPETPAPAIRLIERCLSYRPDLRFASSAELEDEWRATPPAPAA
jgi:serine/threonine protein kinase